MKMNYKIRGVAYPGEVDMKVVGEVLEHVDVHPLLLRLAVEAVLPADVPSDGVRLRHLDGACDEHHSLTNFLK
jgi:hypothetical protein